MTKQAWNRLPAWQRILTLVVGWGWLIGQVEHPWLIELYRQVAWVAWLLHG